MTQPRPEIETLQRYIPGKPIEAVVRELGLLRVIKLASNENPLGPSPLALQAVQKALFEMQLYPDDLAYSLKHALAEHFQIDESYFVVGNGGVEIIRMVAEVFVRPHDEVLVASPSFAIYKEDIKLMGGTLVEIPLDSNFYYDLPQMQKAITPKTRLVILCSPNNPTGTIIFKNNLEAFLENLPKEVLVVLDEAYSDFVEDKNYHNGIDYVKQGYPLIVLRTFSKVYGLAGIRVGYAIAPPSIARWLNQVRVLFNVNALAQVAAIAALKDEAHREKTRTLIWNEKAFLYEELKKLGVRFVPTQSNFFVVEVGRDLEVFQALLQRGIIIRPGTNLGMPGWIRVTIGSREENLFFLAGLQSVLQQTLHR
jgi:histidinol-phosphate aminotransferase